MRKERGLVKAHGKGITLGVIRRCCQLSQYELGEKAGISESLVALVETGRRQPSLENAKAICEALSDGDVTVPVEAIFEIVDSTTEEPASEAEVA